MLGLDLMNTNVNKLGFAISISNVVSYRRRGFRQFGTTVQPPAVGRGFVGRDGDTVSPSPLAPPSVLSSHSLS